MSNDQRIVNINIEEEMKSAYIDYSMSVIVSRALPDVRDGLKPVHRRVLYGMSDLGLASNKSHKKSARIVGEVLGKYHPHGDTSVYDAMVRMAQTWSLRYPLVDGQGNFGSMDGDSPAAMRYTEAKLQKISDEILADIKKDTVDFSLNFDDTLEEPTVLPTRLPNLLINGASGIAVGMATNMLPHNLSEVLAGVSATVDNPDITIDELMEHIKAPDFPTGGIIYGYQGVKEAFHTGRGKVVVRAKADIETAANGRETIIVTEIPYQVNKATLVAKIAELVNEEKITGISDVRDESDRVGLRIVIEIKRDAMANVILSKLFKYSQLQTSYGVNNIALVNGRPQQLNLKQIIVEFIKFRLEVIVRRTQYDLKKAQERAHILEGLLIALDNIDAVIKIIRASKTVDEARDGLMSSFDLSELQSKAILEMRLQKLVSLEINKIQEEYDELMKKIDYLQSILDSEDLRRSIIKEELAELEENYGDKRRTEISYSDGEISIEDMIPNESVVITISTLGYIKRTRSDEFKAQNRGGKGSRGSKTRDTDEIEHIFAAHTHNYILLFTEMGRCYWLRAYEIPEASKTAAGRVIQNLIQLPKEDKIKAYIKIEDLKDPEFMENHFIVLCTKDGTIKKTAVDAFSRPRANGINAITIKEGDQLLEAKLTDGKSDILMANKGGRAIRFPESTIRAMGRGASGVRGIRLDDENDRVVGMIIVDPKDQESTVFVVSENGYGKRSEKDDYRVTNRGGKGVKTMAVSDKTGEVIAIKAVTVENDLMITTTNGIMIRLRVEDVRVMGRATQGVRVITLAKKDSIADIAVLKSAEEEEEVYDEDGNLIVADEDDIEDADAESTDDTTDDSAKDAEDESTNEEE